MRWLGLSRQSKAIEASLRRKSSWVPNPAIVAGLNTSSVEGNRLSVPDPFVLLTKDTPPPMWSTGAGFHTRRRPPRRLRAGSWCDRRCGCRDRSRRSPPAGTRSMTHIVTSTGAPPRLRRFRAACSRAYPRGAVRRPGRDVDSVRLTGIWIQRTKCAIKADAELPAGACREIASSEVNPLPAREELLEHVLVVVPVKPTFHGRPFRGRDLSRLRVSGVLQQLSASGLLAALIVRGHRACRTRQPDRC